jgi:adenosylhomocysteine nucleosidase
VADTVVLVSATAEWAPVREAFPDAAVGTTPFGEWFAAEVGPRRRPVLFVFGGWGKIAAAASAQYALDRWSPRLVVNLGTCGGFSGAIERGTVLLVERTLVYDVVELMADSEAAVAHYATVLDLSWLPERSPTEVRRGLLLSADRDIGPDDLPRLRRFPGAVAADWESGAIAYVAARNGTRCLILRGVSDLVGEDGGEAYNGHGTHFEENARSVMLSLLDALPAWIEASA